MEFTEDAVFRGKIKVFQPPRGKGYRFSMDSVLLGCFASRGRAEEAVDLGAGSGVVGFILLFSGAAGRVIFVERDAALVRACRLGIEANGYGDMARVVKSDIRKEGWKRGLKKVGLVVSNPPYRRKGAGRVSFSGTVAAAKHEITMSVADVIQSASEVLESRGRLCLVVSPERLEDVFGCCGIRGLNIVRMRFVHTKPGREAENVLVEIEPGAGKRHPLRILPPLVVMREDGSYTREVGDLLEGKFITYQ